MTLSYAYTYTYANTNDPLTLAIELCRKLLQWFSVPDSSRSVQTRGSGERGRLSEAVDRQPVFVTCLTVYRTAVSQ